MVPWEIRRKATLLKVRRFVQGRDEEDWVRVWNAAYKEQEDFRQMTVDDVRALEKAPEFDAAGKFIVELNNQSVGILDAYVDKLREEKKGFVRSFGVVPEFRGKGIEKMLAETALQELKKRGMKVAQAFAVKTQKDIVRLWENLGFKLVRKFSLMKKDLDTVPSNVGENKQVMLKPLRRDVDEDLKLLNWLDNECFKEHFNYRPSPIERTIYSVRENPFFKDQAWFFAVLNGEHVGFVGVGIDEKYNAEKNAKIGWVLDIGVLKPYRRRGIGARMILHGMNTLKAKGMTTVMLGVDDWNVTKAMKLYEKLGFSVVKKELAYEREIE